MIDEMYLKWVFKILKFFFERCLGCYASQFLDSCITQAYSAKDTPKKEQLENIEYSNKVKKEYVYGHLFHQYIVDMWSKIEASVYKIQSEYFRDDLYKKYSKHNFANCTTHN